LVFCLGFACRQKPNVLECALALMSVILFIVVVFFTLTGNGRRYVLFAYPTIGGLAWFLPSGQPDESCYTY